MAIVPDMSRAAKKELTNNAALLYGLIHARFICSIRGLDLMVRTLQMHMIFYSSMLM